MATTASHPGTPPTRAGLALPAFAPSPPMPPPTRRVDPVAPDWRPL
ncbi:hypothetical protein [Coralloluteibacterium thermophilus]|uniref:Uncharacterized protein n=1 Tax=Coralloluteibacterium thermophilum TaxID=2707049 RepID=A0ABV9NGY9_9GAMM